MQRYGKQVPLPYSNQVSVVILLKPGLINNPISQYEDMKKAWTLKTGGGEKHAFFSLTKFWTCFGLGDGSQPANWVGF